MVNKWIGQWQMVVMARKKANKGDFLVVVGDGCDFDGFWTSDKGGFNDGEWKQPHEQFYILPKGSYLDSQVIQL